MFHKPHGAFAILCDFMHGIAWDNGLPLADTVALAAALMCLKGVIARKNGHSHFENEFDGIF